jgi:sec-independent protein translocase protein TatC
VKLPFKKKSPDAAPEPTEQALGQMSLTDHLAELRMRIIRSALAVLVGLIVVMVFYNPILNFLQAPYDKFCDSRVARVASEQTVEVPDTTVGEPSASDPPSTSEAPVTSDQPTSTDATTSPGEGATSTFSCALYTTSPMEGFSTRFRVSMYGGVILAIPVLLWQLWKFIVPGLHPKEKKYAIPFILTSVVLFLCGGALAYLTLDKGLEFLINFSGDDVQQVFQVSKYISFVGLMVAAFGVGLEFPVLLTFLQLVGVVNHRTLIKQWRLAICGIVALAAVITPSGDPITLAALAIPMIVLYFVSVFIGRIVQRRREAAEAAA